jgi:catechol 2,3-dioxygenase-like lactoylglutathione lyase family enzyme
MGDEARWLVVGIPGTTTGVSLAGPGMLEDQTYGGYTGITIATDDLDAARARVTTAGVRVTQTITEMPWGDRATWFADPDDNTFYLIQSAGQAEPTASPPQGRTVESTRERRAMLVRRSRIPGLVFGRRATDATP